MKTPYKYWNRSQLFEHLKAQLDDKRLLDADTFELLEKAVYDDKWNPSEQYNGCNVVQDDLHPFFPCFIHDWRWITNQNTKEADYEFYYHLKQMGYTEAKARLYYIAVRLGWIFYYKWK